jgi:hypothetical protein
MQQRYHFLTDQDTHDGIRTRRLGAQVKTSMSKSHAAHNAVVSSVRTHKRTEQTK